MTPFPLDLLTEGIKANHSDAYRRKNLITLGSKGSLVVAGDLHGHSRNIERILSYCDLAQNPTRHLILQEIIHGGPQTPEGGCLSYRALFDAIRLKLQFPNQVHFLMGNHDTAFITGSEIMKDGREMNHAMDLAMRQEFQGEYTEVRQALYEFLISQPLAAKTANRLWMSHSLPSDRYAEQFSTSIFTRPITPEDCKKPGSVYLLTWGRHMSQPLLNRLAQTFDVDFFILGHQPQTEGWNQAGDNLLIIASEHNHGCLIHVDLARQYDLDGLVHAIVPLSSIL